MTFYRYKSRDVIFWNYLLGLFGTSYGQISIFYVILRPNWSRNMHLYLHLSFLNLHVSDSEKSLFFIHFLHFGPLTCPIAKQLTYILKNGLPLDSPYHMQHIPVCSASLSLSIRKLYYVSWAYALQCKMQAIIDISDNFRDFGGHAMD